MNYSEVTKYLDSFINYEKNTTYKYKVSLNLERIKDFLELIGNPQKSFRSIHIAGTKGKGSVSVFCAYILRELGFKTGLYTSPHLISIRERIRILNSDKNLNDVFEGLITEKEFCILVKELKPKIDLYSRNSILGPLSYFEIITALAFEYFKKQRIDFAVLETGIGGRLDATNVVDALVCAITTIGFDHMDKLGNTLHKIAQEKAGIIKKNARYLYPIVISSPQKEEVNRVLVNKCTKEQLVFLQEGKDFKYKLKSFNLNYQKFDVEGIIGNYKQLKIKLLGQHQLINASLALGVIWALEKLNQVELNKEKIKKGLLNTKWPVRFEIISRKPFVVLDGAHNEDSMVSLVQTLKEYFPKNKFIFILGASKDKDIKAICRPLVGHNFKIILTKSSNIRAASTKDIAKYLVRENIDQVKNIEFALNLAKKQTDKNTVIVIAGSIFLAAQAREILYSI